MTTDSSATNQGSEAVKDTAGCGWRCAAQHGTSSEPPYAYCDYPNCGCGPEPERLEWSYSEKCWGQTARARFNGLDLIVNDCDGDASEWFILLNGEQVSSGTDHGHEPYHFHKCIEDCERQAAAMTAPASPLTPPDRLSNADGIKE